MPITLNEALCGDTEAAHALETGVIQLLPHLDLSGRQLLFLHPCRHTKNGYSSAALLRAVWYMIEVAAHEKQQDIEGGIVEIVWDKESTVWDYGETNSRHVVAYLITHPGTNIPRTYCIHALSDSQVYSRWTYFETHAWPTKITAFHVCLPPPFILRIIFPIMMALTDKRARARTMIHNVPESDIIEVLSSYGILKHMLPTVIGGDLAFDQIQWIINRRVAEMEELG